MPLYHNTRSLACRDPMGAVRAGTPVTLRLLGAEHLQDAVVRAWYNGIPREFPMRRVHAETFEAVLETPETPGLCWYDFRTVRNDGSIVFLGAPDDGMGGEGHETRTPRAFQITVYDPDFQVPRYMRDGIMYQIFPDRFYRSKMPSSPRKEIFIHENWDDVPIMMPNSRTDNQALDFYGGDLNGIREKLPYLESLGVTVIYLNPIFLSRSNHRYDTGDYTRIDPMLGTEEDFKALCAECEKRGMRVMLDGVFNHTGDDSIYFNRYGTFPEKGAYQSMQSRWYKWYTFTRFPNTYACWWGIDNVPTVNKDDPDYQEFILGEYGIVRRWLAAGAGAWRLDVADELSMDMLRRIRAAAKAERADCAIVGEVWEDASRKEVWGETRCYCAGDTLDSVMNYPLRSALLDFLTFRCSSRQLARLILSQQENYSLPFYYSVMNILGTHDRPRTINVLAGRDFNDVPPKERGKCTLTDEELALGKSRYLEMLRIICALPGIPCVYYGDEAGLWGAADPFNRGTYPWGHEDTAFLEEVRAILKKRSESRILKTGSLSILTPDDETIVIIRSIEGGKDVFGESAMNGTVSVSVTRG